MVVCLTLLLSFPVNGFISGQLISMTNPINRIASQFVNKPQIPVCDRVLSINLAYFYLGL